jgi:adenylate kinase
MRLSHHYVIPHISTGDMLRGETKAGTELGLEAQRYMDAGELIPDEIVLKMVAQRLDQDDTRTRGFVLDGFPRTVPQAEGLEELLTPASLDLAVNIVVPTPLVLRRLASRRVCEDCAAIYSTVSPPRVPWICDACGGEVIHREDDTEAAISRRLDLYDRETQPLIAWYRHANTLVSISGVGSQEAVSDRLIGAVDDHRSATGGFGAPLRAIAGDGGDDSGFDSGSRPTHESGNDAGHESANDSCNDSGHDSAHDSSSGGGGSAGGHRLEGESETS